MPITLLASFPNSRIKPRNPTSLADTLTVAVPSGITTQVLAADPLRTYVCLRNADPVNDCYYGYRNNITALDGFPLKSLEPRDDIESQQAIYVYQNSGSPVNISIDFGQG